MINPYLKLPIVLPGNENDPGDKEVEARIQPDQIQVYQPCYHWGSLIYMLGGGCVLMTKLSCEELDKIISGYWNAMDKRERDQQNNLPKITLLQ